MYNVTKVFYFKQMLFFWAFYLSDIPKKQLSQFPQKILSSTHISNIDQNNKYFWSTKSAY